MTDRRVTDGVRIAELLSSELHGRTDGVLAHVAVTDAVADATPTEAGVRAYDVVWSRDALVAEPEQDVAVLEVDVGEADGERFASVFVHPDRARVEFHAGVDVAAAAADGTRLRVRPKATTPPRTLAFVESGAAVKDAVDVASGVVDALLDDS
ncbi:hypothetical protein [Halorubellus sp. PRR65]|uniref:hypothetical protein n=1 Tax=Halorubellus sp. PRR65 TaxID=3098148 RepID=UPI002B25E290|nr:hypothetical protein [Halorubellus sp. PRR65]